MLKIVISVAILFGCLCASLAPFTISRQWLIAEWSASIDAEISLQRDQCAYRSDDLRKNDPNAVVPTCQPENTTEANSGDPRRDVVNQVWLVNRAQAAMNSLKHEQGLVQQRIDQYLLVAKLAAFGAWGGLGHAIGAAIGVLWPASSDDPSW
jgi:hypothetical protein